jgi:hypothetical protein
MLRIKKKAEKSRKKGKSQKKKKMEREGVLAGARPPISHPHYTLAASSC